MTSPLRSLVAGLRRLFRGARDDDELAEELAHFVQESADARADNGQPVADAFRQAHAEVGSVAAVQEEVRAAGWEARLVEWWRDISFGVRSLRRSAGFTAAAVATLALGLAAVTTVFSVLNAVLLRPPAHVRAPDELVAIYTSDFSGPPYGASSWPDWEDIRAQGGVLVDALAFSPRLAGFGEGDALERLGAELVSGNYFSVLGVTPAAGRFFVADEGKAGAPAVAVVSYDLWRRRLAGAPGAIGSTIRLNGRAFTVIGVAPDGYEGAQRGLRSDLWVVAPVALREWAPPGAAGLTGADAAAANEYASRGNRMFMVMARRTPSVGPAAVQAAMRLLATHLAEAWPDAWRDVRGAGRRLTVVEESAARVPPGLRNQVLGFFGLLLGVVGLVLLLCCANVASLTLARVSRRTREIGVRLSLGAGRGRVVRLLVVEGLLVALVGGAIGLLVTRWITGFATTLQPPGVPVRIGLDLSIDGRVLGFALAATVFTGALFAFFPAWRGARLPVAGLIRNEGLVPLTASRRVSVQSVLVTVQMAVSVLLLSGALVFVRTLSAATSIDLGFPTDHVLLTTVEPRADVTERVDAAQVLTTLREQVAAIPGVEEASWATQVALSLNLSRRGVQVDAYRAERGEDMEFPYSHVGPAYFSTMRIPLAGGREFTALDRAGAPPVAMVNEAFARRFWPGQPALGQRISTSGDGAWMEVVGIVRDVRTTSLTEAPRPYMYFPSLQDPSPATLHVRTRIDPQGIAAAVRQVVSERAPQWSVTSSTTMEQQVAAQLMPQRIASGVLSLFGVLMLLLAAVGLYGVMAYAVSARAREMGVRAALGARRRDVVSLVVWQGARLAAIGLVTGLPAAWGATRLISAFLIGGRASPLAFVGAAAILTAAALLASWLPARRAARVAPMVALRLD